jgi:hypothetical protein
MDLRTARLTAWGLVLTVILVGIGCVIAFGEDAPFPRRFDGSADGVAVWWPTGAVMIATMVQAVLSAGVHALILARGRRWRRNLVRAGGYFAISWVTGPVLMLAFQLMGIAAKLGYRPDAIATVATIIGAILLFKANMLTKSRPGWFNGLVFPPFARRDDVWRRVHRASAWRGAAIGFAFLLLPWAHVSGAGHAMSTRDLMIALLVADLAIGTAHAILLSLFTEPDEREGVHVDARR